MRQLLSLLLSCSSLLLLAQSSQTLELTEFGKDKHFNTSRSILPVFKLENNQVEAFRDFGVPEDDPKNPISVKLPETGACRDTGYFYLYSNFGGKNKSAYTPVMVLNYGRRTYPAVFFVDRNQNFDFTDDGTPDTFYFVLKYFDIRIQNPHDTLQSVVTRISRFPFNEDLKFKKLADEYYKMYSGRRKFVGTDFSFREQRFQIRSSQAIANNDTFTLSLLDANFNGLYNEPEVDQILLDLPGVELVSRDKSFPIAKDTKERYFERSFKSYKVLAIDPYGRSITFQFDPSKKAKRQLVEGEKVPKFTFRDPYNNKEKLRWYSYKPVYIYFWSKETPEFEDDTAALRIIQEKFCPMIKIIALNYGDNPRMLEGYVEFNKVYWLNGVATKNIMETFNVEEVPYGFLLKKGRRLYKKGISPQEVLQMLEEGIIQSW
ncbi:MAG: hypothetical protein EP332_00560 [Bacteroidetes bacterium]|nr:MAG: hypothetical protein EP332_00560 [Bacteroidota bacterium]